MLLLNVGELGVAKGEEMRIFEDGIGESLKTSEEFVLAEHGCTVAPACVVIIHYPTDAAVFAHKHGQFGFINLQLGLHSPKLVARNALVHFGIIGTEKRGILLVIVNVVHVGSRSRERATQADNSPN